MNIYLHIYTLSPKHTRTLSHFLSPPPSPTHTCTYTHMRTHTHKPPHTHAHTHRFPPENPENPATADAKETAGWESFLNHAEKCGFGSNFQDWSGVLFAS